MVRTFFEEKNKRLSKEKGLINEDIYQEKIKLLQTKDCGEWRHTYDGVPLKATFSVSKRFKNEHSLLTKLMKLVHVGTWDMSLAKIWMQNLLLFPKYE